MRIVLIAINLLVTFQLFSQLDKDANQFNNLTIEEKRDFVINELLNDTIKFSKEDIYHAAIGTKNRNSYSELYIINGKQIFKFDIVETHCVKEFIDKYLEKSRIKSISKLSKKQGLALYGTSGKNGITVINIKRLRKVKINNCGFIRSKGNSGSNLDQWKKGEIRIRS